MTLIFISPLQSMFIIDVSCLDFMKEPIKMRNLFFIKKVTAFYSVLYILNSHLTFHPVFVEHPSHIAVSSNRC